MKSIFQSHSLPKVGTVLLFALLFSTNIEAQTKQIKRPSSRVGVTSVDNFVRESFDLYDKVYMYDGYAEAGTPLDDSDIDVLENALSDLDILTASVPSIISDLDGVSVFKKAKATLQVNKAQKALKYSIKTAKELLFGERQSDDTESNDEVESDDDEDDSNNQNEEEEAEEAQENVSDNLEVYSNFDFVAGGKILMFDDFSLDNIGDFPSKWNTNGTGELVTIDNEKWFKLAGNSVYIPDLPSDLPQDYTIEFDMLTELDKKTSSQAKLEIWLEDNNLFNPSKNRAKVEIPLCLFISVGFIVENEVARKRVIRNTIEKDIRNLLSQKNHISIAVNGKRFRMWVNENKVVDVPRLIPENIVSFKLHPRDIRDGIDKVFINNVKIAQGGLDLRSQLLKDGKFSTTGILFNSGSDTIKPESFGVLKEIAEALQQDSILNLNIIGHTDADGNDGQNLILSEKRAASVKNALSSQFNIDKNRLKTEGKGETEPVDTNTTTEGKANNRRVEFVKN